MNAHRMHSGKGDLQFYIKNCKPSFVVHEKKHKSFVFNDCDNKETLMCIENLENKLFFIFEKNKLLSNL